MGSFGAKKLEQTMSSRQQFLMAEDLMMRRCYQPKQCEWHQALYYRTSSRLVVLNIDSDTAPLLLEI